MNILGISCFYHDSAAALLKDGMLVAAAEEERFTRVKHTNEFPIEAIKYCLAEGGIGVEDIDYIAFYEKPFIKLERLLYSYFAAYPRGLKSFLVSMPLWLKKKLAVPQVIQSELGELIGDKLTQSLSNDGKLSKEAKREIKAKVKGFNINDKLLFIEHHLAHAASTYLVSPFDEAAILTIDGIGEWASATYGIGRGKNIELFKEMRFPHSVGLLYSAITGYLGFRVNGGEGKVMGLAPYGKPRYRDKFDELLKIAEDGSIKLNMKYFAYHYSLNMYNRNLIKLLGREPRVPESELDEFYCDIAATLQDVTEEIFLKMANHLYKTTGSKNICLAGGVALNCVANGRVIAETPFERIFVQPGAGDSGTAIGSVIYTWTNVLNNERIYEMKNSYLGPAYTDEQIQHFLESNNIDNYQRLSYGELIQRTAKALSEKKVVGWFRGRMEFGPRALGTRSILASPIEPEMKDIVNKRIKERESFRPFAPVCCLEDKDKYFEIPVASPFMLLACPVKEDKRNVIPAITHVDGSARLQTIEREQNPAYYDLIKEFERLTGVGVLLNTSFNKRGEPIVCAPEQAYNDFVNSDMDVLVLEDFILYK